MRCQTLLAAVLLVPLTAPVAHAQLQSVRLHGDARAVFTQLGERYGVRVVIDADFPARAITLRLNAADFPTALRLAAETAGAFWVERDDGTIFVAANTPEKRRQYEPQVVQTFVLPGQKPDELAETVRLLREVLDMRRIQADVRSNTFTVRDTPQRLALAAELLEQLRSERGEVLVEALVLEVNRTRAQRLGILPPQQVTIVHLGSGFVDLAQTGSVADILRPLLERGLIPERFFGVPLQTLLALLNADPDLLAAALPPFILIGGGATTFAANLPGAQLNLLHLASVTRSLRRLELRARHGEEGVLFAGERFPIVLATFSSLFFPPEVLELIRRGLFVPPIPATQYEELGLKLAATPYLHGQEEVSLRLRLDLRTLTSSTLNNIPIFSNRVLEQTVRLKAGEALLLSGLVARSQEDVRQGLPVLGHLPGLGYLFSQRQPRVEETELVLLLRPRRLRTPAGLEAAARPLYIGTEARFSSLASVPATPAPATVPAPPREEH